MARKTAWVVPVLMFAALWSPPSAKAQESGLIARLEALEERRFEGGDIKISSDPDRRSLTDGSRCNPGAEDDRRGALNGRVDFKKPFVRTPKVVVGIRAFDISPGAAGDAVRLNLEVTSVDPKGFNYAFVTWCRSQVWTDHGAAHGSWFAFLDDLEDAPGEAAE